MLLVTLLLIKKKKKTCEIFFFVVFLDNALCFLINTVTKTNEE